MNKDYLHGGDVYHHAVRLDYSVNLNPLGTPASVIQAARDSIGQIQQYPDPEQAALTEALGKTLHIPQEQLLFGNGAAELIDAFLASAAPRRILLPEPSFSEYRRIPELEQCEIIPFSLKEADQFQIMEEDILSAIGPSVDLVILCTPNNPNGAMIRPELLKKILERCGITRTRVLLDECFVMLSEHPEYATGSYLLQAFPHLFVLRTFTKSFAMPGLRLGYGISSDRTLLEKMRKRLQPWNISIPATAAGIAALQETAHVAEARELIRKERVYLSDGLCSCGLTVYESDSNYLLFRGPETLKEDLQKQEILIRDCSNYHGLCRGFFRIAVRNHEDNIQLLDALGRIIHG